jgi:hypothetical protein
MAPLSLPMAGLFVRGENILYKFRRTGVYELKT